MVMQLFCKGNPSLPSELTFYETVGGRGITYLISKAKNIYFLPKENSFATPSKDFDFQNFLVHDQSKIGFTFQEEDFEKMKTLQFFVNPELYREIYKQKELTEKVKQKVDMMQHQLSVRSKK